MKITLYMAISVDGFITKDPDDTDWVSESDADEFYGYMKTSDAVIMGRNTMDHFREGEFPIEGIYNIVLSTDESLHQETGKVKILEGTPSDVISFATTKGFKNLLIIGGENINKQFLKAGLIDEIVLSVHPLIIGKGLQLFGNDDYDTKLHLLDTKIINNELVQLKYEFLKHNKISITN